MILKFIVLFLWQWNCHTMMNTHIQSADKTHVALLLFSFFWVFALALFQQNPSKSPPKITAITLFSIDSRLVEIWSEVCTCVCFQIIFVTIKTLYHGWIGWVNDGWMGGWLEDWLQFVWSWVLCYNVKTQKNRAFITKVKYYIVRISKLFATKL